jgi:phosphoglycolate phosphatase
MTSRPNFANSANRSFDGVIFDLDGTLLDSLQDIAEAANSVLLSMGSPVYPVSEYRYLVGDGVGMLFQRALPLCVTDDELRNECVRQFEIAYTNCWKNHSKPYDGILELLNLIRSADLKLGILSNKLDPFTKKCASHFFPSISFDMVVGHSDQFPRKPDPSSALWMARTFGLQPGRIAYVGDTNTDMKTAVSAGFYAIGVAWGFRPETELREHGARVVAHAPSELKAILLS